MRRQGAGHEHRGEQATAHEIRAYIHRHLLHKVGAGGLAARVAEVSPMGHAPRPRQRHGTGR
jgi:hypothetical protein